jgi:hypothetical protein
MNIKPVERDFFRMTSKAGNQKLVIEMDRDSTLDEMLTAFKNFLNASGFDYVAGVEASIYAKDDEQSGFKDSFVENQEDAFAEEDLPF